MPLREYACGGCGLVFTELMSGHEPERTCKCEECGQEAELKMPVVAVTHPRDAMQATNPKLDVVIGQGAEQLRARYKEKKEARKPVEEASGGRGVFQESDGSYRPLTEGEGQQREAVFAEASRQRNME